MWAYLKSTKHKIIITYILEIITTHNMIVYACNLYILLNKVLGCYLSELFLESQYEGPFVRLLFQWHFGKSLFKVRIFWGRPQNFAKSSPYFWLQFIQSKVRGRFCKILWPSQNIWTLKEELLQVATSAKQQCQSHLPCYSKLESWIHSVLLNLSQICF